MTSRPCLRRLADVLGILPDYVTWNRAETKYTTDHTCERLAAAMGFDASTEASAQRELNHLHREQADSTLPPVRVLAARPGQVPTTTFSLPESASGKVDWQVELALESGETLHREGTTPARDGWNVEIPLFVNPPPGYHELRLETSVASRSVAAKQSFIVTPTSCRTAREKLNDRRVFGVTADLYSIRSSRNLGVGDIGDLADLAGWAAGHGAAFVGVNPLHAVDHTRGDASPYRPASRLLRNPFYLAVDRIPECDTCESARKRLETGEVRDALETLRGSDRVDYGHAWSIKLRILRELHTEFLRRHGDGSTERGREFQSFCRGNPRIIGALTESAEARNNANDSPEREVELNAFLQFELNRQLAFVHDEMKSGGASIGLYHDLAIGVAPDALDVKVYPALFASGASVGAPPDDLGPEGQNWGLPPVIPRRLQSSAFRYWIDVLRAAMRHAGAIRIDHVMGLLRQFWIPEGEDGTGGAYVAYPADDLAAILALESVRNDCLVIGEDLGTVPQGFPNWLEKWGILSTQVLFFQRDHQGEFIPISSYSHRAITSLRTHDLVPLAGYIEGTDLQLRRKIGAIESDEQLARETSARAGAGDAMRRRLIQEGCLPAAIAGAPDADALCVAVHDFLARTPSPLVAAGLDDLAREKEPVNLPGVGPDRHSNWTRKLAAPLSEILADPTAEKTMGVLSAHRGRSS